VVPIVWLLPPLVTLGAVEAPPDEGGEVVLVGGDGEVLVGVERVAPVVVVDAAGVVVVVVLGFGLAFAVGDFAWLRARFARWLALGAGAGCWLVTLWPRPRPAWCRSELWRWLARPWPVTA
jgi:hypothetical protein